MGEIVALPVDAPAWPDAPREAMFDGLVGEYVRLADPETEADPAAVAAQLVIAFGNMIGRGAHCVVGAKRHHTNEFLLLVGDSAYGAKGSSLAVVRHILRPFDPEWSRSHVGSGLASGEGLIHRLRDPSQRADEGGRAKPDPGVTDKRMLLVEEEFETLLGVLSRDGSTASGIVRKGWDSENLENMAKGTPAVVTEPHISIIGHVTPEAVLQRLNSIDIANGFLNRFLIVMCRESKELPLGGDMDNVDFSGPNERMRAALAHGRSAGKLLLTSAGEEFWVPVARSLKDSGPGVSGQALRRGRPHVLRLALMYALLDCKPAVDESHLRSACAFYGYVMRSTRHLFGNSLGNPIADEILRLIRSNGGMTRTELGNALHRNKSREQLQSAVDLLEKSGLIARSRKQNPRGGPAAEVLLPARTRGAEVM